MKIVELSTLTPLAEGTRRLVFQHPDHDDLLIKVLKPGSFREDGQPKRRKFYKFARREGAFIYYLREISEYLAVRIANQTHRSLPISAIYGPVETDLGPGLVVEKIKGRNGGLARTLRQVVDVGEFDSAMRQLFEDFIQDLISMHVVAHELSIDNIVLCDEFGSRKRFVCIDGIGSRTLIPVKEWSKWLNARKILRFRKAFLQDQLNKQLQARAPEHTLRADLSNGLSSTGNS